MKRIIYFSAFILLLGACKKKSVNNTLSPQLAEAAKVVGTYQISSYTDANGNLTVYTPQNSPGTITVTKTDAAHFHVVLTPTQNGIGPGSSHDYAFTDITGDGYVHFTETNNKSTAQFVDEGGPGDAFDIDIKDSPNDIMIVFPDNVPMNQAINYNVNYKTILAYGNSTHPSDPDVFVTAQTANQSSGSFTVTAINSSSQTVSGTFNAVATSQNDGAVNITNGKFYMPFKVEQGPGLGGNLKY